MLPLVLGQECTDNEVRLVDGFTDSYNGEGFAQLCYNGQWHYISSNTTDYVQQVCDQLGHPPKVKGMYIGMIEKIHGQKDLCSVRILSTLRMNAWHSESAEPSLLKSISH